MERFQKPEGEARLTTCRHLTFPLRSADDVVCSMVRMVTVSQYEAVRPTAAAPDTSEKSVILLQTKRQRLVSCISS